MGGRLFINAEEFGKFKLKLETPMVGFATNRPFSDIVIWKFHLIDFFAQQIGIIEFVLSLLYTISGSGYLSQDPEFSGACFFGISSCYRILIYI